MSDKITELERLVQTQQAAIARLNATVAELTVLVFNAAAFERNPQAFRAQVVRLLEEGYSDAFYRGQDEDFWRRLSAAAGQLFPEHHDDAGD